MSRTNSFLGGLASAIFRLLSYVFLSWLPGRFAPYIPLFFAASGFSLFYHNLTRPQLAPPKASLEPASDSDLDLPTQPPSFAAVVASGTENEKPEDVPLVKAATAHDALVPNGTTPRRRNKSSRSQQSPATYVTSDLPKPTATSAISTIFSLLFGTPSVSPVINTASLLINIVLLAAVLDSLWSPIWGMKEDDLAFVRVGLVDHQSVKLLARVPPLPVAAPANETAPDGLWTAEVAPDTGAKVAYRPTKPVGRWIMGPEFKVSEGTDWVAVVRIDGLYASTEYEYRLLLPTLSNAHHPAFPAIQTFTTFPDPALSSPAAPGGGTHFTFAATACVKPGFPYRGPLSKRDVVGAGYLLDAAKEQSLKFLLFLGDFIYSDTPYYAGPERSSYLKRYRQVMAAPLMKALLTKLPTIAMFDDHEIYNDYSASVQEARPASYPPAMTAFQTYLGLANPDPVTPDVHYFEFQHGDAAFFVWDTRSYRSANHAVDDEEKTMLGEQQKTVFFDWLARVNQTVTWKFVVSSVPLMSLWSMGDDTWAGFLTERDAVLDVLEFVPNVIVLSGDRHEFAAASIRTSITEFSTSPLSQFYVPIRTLSQSNGRGATGEDILLNYLPDGNSKFSTFEVDTRVANQPVVRVRVIIDGVEAWAVDVQGKALEIPPPPSTVGSLGKSLMELLGFKRRSWF